MFGVPKEDGRFEGPTGKLLINLRPQSTTREIPETTTHIRIVLDGGSPGLTRNIKADIAISEFPATIEVPVGEYEIKVVAYKKDAFNNGVALTYAKTTVAIEENKTAQASLVLERINGPTLQTYTDYLYNNEKYNVRYNKNPNEDIMDVDGLKLKIDDSMMFYGDTAWQSDSFSGNRVGFRATNVIPNTL